MALTLHDAQPEHVWLYEARMESDSTLAMKQTIRSNAEEICRLTSAVKGTYALCSRSPEHEARWHEACRDFHERYEALAFPGGYDAGLAGLAASDPAAVDAALCFLEVRPYFFRSGYMFKDILRTVKRAAQNRTQAQRLDRIVAAYAAYRATRRRSTDPVAAKALRKFAERRARRATRETSETLAARVMPDDGASQTRVGARRA